MADPNIGDDFARLDALVGELDVCAHRFQRLVKAGAQRIDDHPADNNLRARHNHRGNERERGRRWVGANGQLGARRAPLLAERDDPAARGIVHFDLAAELAQHDFAMVAAGDRLDDLDRRSGAKPGEQDRGLDLG